MSKILLATAILGLGIAGAIFAVQQIELPENSALTAPSENSNISNQPFVEKIVNAKLTRIDSEENLTSTFNEVLAQKIAASNPNGLEIISGKKSVKAPDPDKLAEELILEAAKKFDPSKLSPVIKDSDLKISKDNSETAIKIYINEFQKIVMDAANQIPTEAVTDEPDLSQFPILSGIYMNSVSKFYKLSVPESALTIHKKQITLLTKEAYIFSAIGNYKDDPLTTLLVSQELEKVELEFEEFAKEFNQFIKKYSA